MRQNHSSGKKVVVNPGICTIVKIAMEFLLLNVLLAAIPAVIIIIFIYRMDQGDKEPRLFVFMAFVIGFFAVIPAIVIEILLSGLDVHFGSVASRLFRAFIVAATVEEGVKLLSVRLFLYKSRYFNEVADGILYTMVASLGFAFFENILYSFGTPLIMITRGVTAVPLHASASGILGYYIGLTKVTGKSRLITGLMLAVFIHGLYDYLLFTGSWLGFLVFPVLIASILTLAMLFKRARRLDKELRTERG